MIFADSEAFDASVRERVVEIELWRLSTAKSGRKWRDRVVAMNGATMASAGDLYLGPRVDPAS